MEAPLHPGLLGILLEVLAQWMRAERSKGRALLSVLNSIISLLDSGTKLASSIQDHRARQELIAELVQANGKILALEAKVRGLEGRLKEMEGKQDSV